MKAQLHTRCAACPARIQPGEEMTWTGDGWAHTSCPQPSRREEPAPPPPHPAAAQNQGTHPGHGAAVPPRTPGTAPSHDWKQRREEMGLAPSGALAVPCPFCGAAPGRACLNDTLKREKTWPHPSRAAAGGVPDPWMAEATRQLNPEPTGA